MSGVRLRNGDRDLLALVTACVGRDHAAVTRMLNDMDQQERLDALIIAVGELAASIEGDDDPEAVLEEWRTMIERERT